MRITFQENLVLEQVKGGVNEKLGFGNGVYRYYWLLC